MQDAFKMSDKVEWGGGGVKTAPKAPTMRRHPAC
jgi:hypothetical protein